MTLRFTLLIGLLCGLHACHEPPNYTPLPDGYTPSPPFVGGSPPTTSQPSAPTSNPEPSPKLDRDRDGLDDATEDALFAQALPALSLPSVDRCGAPMALVYRVSPHPDAPQRVLARVAVLFERDCGSAARLGDVHGFAFSIDPNTQDLLALTTTPQPCPTERCSLHPACETTVARCREPTPGVYFTRYSHTPHLSEVECSFCAISNVELCGPQTTRAAFVALNAGEPDAPLITDLTQAGVITAAQGWTEDSLFHHHPWDDEPFGRAPSLLSVLDNPELIAPSCL